jgi:hypothetical protein
VERGAYYCVACARLSAFDRLRFDPDLEAGGGHGATAHFYPTQHRQRILGKLLRWRAPDAV